VSDRLLPELAHELRNPLNAVQGWVLLMKRQPGDPKVIAEGLAVIERNVRLQARVLTDFTDLAALEAGQLELEVQRVDATGALRTALAAVLAPGEQAAVEQGLPREAIEVLADPERVARMLEVMIRIAAGAGPGAVPPAVAIGTRGGGDGQGFCEVVVEGPAPGTGGTEGLAGGKLRAGTSLDFALARLLARTQRGELAAAPSDHGVRLTLSLPLAAP